MNFPDGLYFSVPEAEYHKIPRFSSSGVKDMRVSPLDFWVNSWLNPEKVEERENGEDSKDSIYKLKGRALHCRLLEGKEEFERRYVYNINIAAIYENVLVTTDDIKKELQAMGVAGLSKLNKPDLVELLLVHNPNAVIYDVERKKFEALHADKQILPADWEKEINFAAMMVEKHPDLKFAFKDGFPEVTVLWTKTLEDVDPITGEMRYYKVPMKCKMDYLKPGAIVDYKSFGNQMERSLKQAVIGEMASRKNHIQVAIYYEAGDEAVKATEEGRVFGWVPNDGPMLMTGISFDENGKDRIRALATPERKFFFVFQKTGPAPVAVGRIMDRSLMTTDIGRLEYEKYALLFAKCLLQFGSDPWLIPGAVESFEDEDFPQWMSYE